MSGDYGGRMTDDAEGFLGSLGRRAPVGAGAFVVQSVVARLLAVFPIDHTTVSVASPEWCTPVLLPDETRGGNLP